MAKSRRVLCRTKMVNLEIKGRQIKWQPVILKELGFLK